MSWCPGKRTSPYIPALNSGLGILSFPRRINAYSSYHLPRAGVYGTCIDSYFTCYTHINYQLKLRMMTKVKIMNKCKVGGKRASYALNNNIRVKSSAGRTMITSMTLMVLPVVKRSTFVCVCIKVC